jgi:ferritin-like metal-binding protein YciE
MKTTTGRNGTKTAGSRKGATSVRTNADAAAQLRELFENELKDIYWAEKAIVKGLAKMIKNATSEELIAGLEEHLAVTEEQVTRVEEIFAAIEVAPRAKKCEGMEGLIKEGEELMRDTEKGMVRDAAIISAAQKIEHYEIASYGTLCAFAKVLGLEEVADLLEQTLEEEKEADSKLTDVAESSVNFEALAESE